MTELVPTRRVPRVIEGEVLPPGKMPLNGNERGFSPFNDRHTFRNYNPFPHMRAMGYTANPDTCRHHRKGYTPRDGWWCRDCGDTLERGNKWK